MRPSPLGFREAARTKWRSARIAVQRVSHRAMAPYLDDLVAEAARSNEATLPVNCIVFSRDRAMQLDACLRSINRFAPYTGQVTVISKATAPEFDEAYRLLHPGPRVRLKAESDDFRRDVMDALDPQSAYTVFHTDDDVFFRRPPVAPALPAGFAAFSLRLGENTTHCYPSRRSQQVPALGIHGPFVAWDWTRADADFSYPLSLNGHVVRTKMLLRILSRARFTNPNELEDELHVRRYRVPHEMLAFRESCLVSIPVNIVSPTHRNPAGSDSEASPSALNARFLAGERIDLDAMDFSSVRGAHQELQLVFKSVYEP
jgi:hypothetical protein